MRWRLAAAGLGALAACTPSGHGDFERPTSRLEIMSWWTSGSESAALAVLTHAFEASAPGVEVESAAVKGGAGSTVQIALARRLREGRPPDVWQTFAGAALRATARDERIADVDAVFAQDGLAEAIPAPILDALTWEGKRWGVPTGAHRQNMLWFNPAVLKRAGLAVPAFDYTSAQFFADLAALKGAGIRAGDDVTPLCLGAKDRFTTTELFEDILLGNIGTKGWSDIAADRFAWRGPAVQKSLDELGRLLDASDRGAAPTTWDEAAQRLAHGKCAFLAMNDSLFGELRADGVGVDDIGAVAFPGTQGTFLAVVDTFVVARTATNGTNAMRFLATVGTAATETAFAKLKGSVPLRADADVAALPAYQQAAAKALRSDAILLSMTHGELLRPPVQQAIYDGVAAFAGSRDPDAFTEKFEAIVAGAVPTGH